MISTEQLRDNMNGKRFCSDINNPECFVTVLNIHQYGSGHQVSFFYEHPKYVVCGLGRFNKRFPHELKDKK